MTAPSSLLARIRSEFLEMPGLKLTLQQACRLWNTNESTCRDLLAELVREGFLFHAPSGAFIAAPSAGRMMKAASVADVRPSRCPHCQHLNSIHVERTVNGSRASMTFRCEACAKVVTVDRIA